eukprot:UN14328
MGNFDVNLFCNFHFLMLHNSLANLSLFLSIPFVLFQLSIPVVFVDVQIFLSWYLKKFGILRLVLIQFRTVFSASPLYLQIPYIFSSPNSILQLCLPWQHQVFQAYLFSLQIVRCK